MKIKTIIKGFVPYGVISLYRRINKLEIKKNVIEDPRLQKNIKFRNKHKGKRCFILGTGPSINQQDLTFLYHEYTIALNLFHLHKDYSIIAPNYHVFSGFFDHPFLNEKSRYELYFELSKKVTSEAFFTIVHDRDYLERHQFFSNKKNLFYVDWSDDFSSLSKKDIDLTRQVFAGNNVVLKAMQIAYYMGFNEIYLLGIDYNWLENVIKKRGYHFYDSTGSVIEKQVIEEYENNDLGYTLDDLARTWKHLRIFREFASERNLKIYNATQGGYLDLFPRVSLEELKENILS